jgi:hypothetical protein
MSGAMQQQMQVQSAPAQDHPAPRERSAPQQLIGNQARLRQLKPMAPRVTEMTAAIRRQDDPPAQPSPVAPATPAPTVPTQGQAAEPADTKVPGGPNARIYGELSLSISGPITFAAWAFGDQQVPGMGIYSPKMTATGTAISDASVPVAEYEMGFVQNLYTSQMTATYTDTGGRPVQYMHIGVSKLPIRDSDKGSKPWSKQGDVKSLDAKEGYIVNTEDRPRNVAPWSSDNGQGSLSKSEGSDVFCTWLAARHKQSGAMYWLGWATWSVDWACSFDATARTGKSTGKGGQEGHSGDGQGGLVPLTGDPVANESITITWTATP